MQTLNAKLEPKASSQQTWLYVVLTLGSLLTAFPFFWMLSTSFKTYSDVFQPGFFPPHPTLDNYVEVISRTSFLRWFLNSILVAAGTTISVLFFTFVVSYIVL